VISETPSQQSDKTNSPATSAPDLNEQVQLLRELADIVRDSRLSELEVERDGVRLSLTAPSRVRRSAKAAPIHTIDDFGEEIYIDDEGIPLAPAGGAPAVSGIPVVSPMVGIFYRASSPSDPNFVEVGDHVEVGKPLGLVEAMKVFNEILSEVSGTVVEIKVENQVLVETGDLLMTIKPD
jgi:acetyl-CoA carboxylase biotin carboxyl carrier protein